MKITEFHVTESHIKAGVKGNPNRCPVALAIKEKLNPAVHVAIGLDYANIGEQSHGLPPAALWFATSFDCGHKVHPIDFTLSIPEQFLRA